MPEKPTTTSDEKPGRRGFLKAVAGTLAAGEAASAQQPETNEKRPKRAKKASSFGSRIEYPRKFSGNNLTRIAFPLGGVGAGSISLGGRGQLRDWEIFNKPDKGKSPRYAFAAIWAQQGSETPVASVLEAAIKPPYEGSSGLGTNNVPGLPRLESTTFTGEFPLAQVNFTDSHLPVQVSLEAFSPFIPLDADESGLPVAILRYRVKNPGKTAAKVAIAWSIDNPVGEQGRTAEFRKADGVQGLFMHNPFISAKDLLAGSFALSATEIGNGKLTYLRGWKGGGRWFVNPQMFWDDFSTDGELGPEGPQKDTVGSICLKRTIAAGAEAHFTFLLAWHFPNRTPKRSGYTAPKGEEDTVIGNHYCTRFKNAWAVAEYVAANLEKLETRTRQFTKAMRESTLPSSVREAAMANLTTLVFPTSFRTADGVFHGVEGCNDQLGCCFGTCTHVWNYETATAHVFPSLSRSRRDASFGDCLDEHGLMSFRQLLPPGKAKWSHAAADGQMGQIMHLYLDWKLSGDTEWLRKLWPGVKKALAFCWIPGGWDANKDGVMEGVQHNTYDVEFYGPNPLCQVWYLGALRAAEEMATTVGDQTAAAEYHRLFESGHQWTDANLFNGEYYIQKVQGIPKDKIAKGLSVGMGAADAEHPDFQVGEGCLVDQLLGQYLADVAGLGVLLNPQHIQSALKSIYRYNYKRNLARHASVQRTYALNDEAGLVICDYGKTERPEVPFPYFTEVWTGLEYSTATTMLSHGMVSEGLELIDNIRLRYDGERRSPWDEAECGHHYARAMASWSPIPVLSGFHYHAGEKRLHIQPKFSPNRIKSFWSTSTGWGTFSQKLNGRNELRLSVIEGELPTGEIALAWPRKTARPLNVKLQDADVSHKTTQEGSLLKLTLDRPAVIRAEQELVITG